MIRFHKNENSEQTSPRLTSLIDVLFILLIFFMISSTFIKPTIRIKLPIAVTREKQPRKKKAVVVLNANKQIYVDRRQVSYDSLEAYAANLVRKTPDINVIFYGDKNISYSSFIETMDRLKRAGIKNIAISHKNGK